MGDPHDMLYVLIIFHHIRQGTFSDNERNRGKGIKTRTGNIEDRETWGKVKRYKRYKLELTTN